MALALLLHFLELVTLFFSFFLVFQFFIHDSPSAFSASLYVGQQPLLGPAADASDLGCQGLRCEGSWGLLGWGWG